MSASLRIRDANCKNCYKCVRACPVKAIAISEAQARVIPERCISCGNCLLACPQNAKEIISDRQKVEQLLLGNAPVYVSLAPALVATWPGVKPGQIVTALRRLGFSSVSQTAVGATLVSDGYQELANRGRVRANPWLTTACPAVVQLVERYHPKLVPFLAPLVSPMVAHARLIKAKDPEARVVFIGPCLAKKGEAARPEFASLIDGVLLYAEVADWLQEAGIEPASLPESKWENFGIAPAQDYPRRGGLLGALDTTDQLVLEADGLEEVADLVDAMTTESLAALLVECNACVGGCLNGPLMPQQESIVKRKERLQRLVEKTRQDAAADSEGCELPKVDIVGRYRPNPIAKHVYAESDIKRVLAQLGKHSESEELNCGACGYHSCREKAEAVLDGRAELDMCIPFMRSRAESLANLAMRSTPNAVIVVDKDMIIHEFNPTAERLFTRKAEAVKGKPLGSVIPDEDFRAVQETGEWIVGRKVVYPQLGLVTNQTINPLESQDLIMGVITDVTKMELQERELTKVRVETIEKAQEVINQQMRVAQEIAGLLGEVTADSKILLLRLIKLVQGEGDER